jgi:hypothetical protein
LYHASRSWQIPTAVAQRTNGLRKDVPDQRTHRWFGITASLSPIHSILPEARTSKPKLLRSGKTGTDKDYPLTAPAEPDPFHRLPVLCKGLYGVVLKLGNFWGEIRQAEVLAIAAPASHEDEDD